MRSFSEQDTRAVFEALCRVERQTAGASRPASDPIDLLLREVGVAAPEEDGFPDFEQERARESDPAITPPPAPPPAAAGSDRRDLVMRTLVGALASYRGLLDRTHRALDDAFPRRDGGRDDDAGVTLLREAQAVLVKYPIAAQAAFAALVREGRRFAATEEGRAWKSRLAGSPLVARARTLFEGLAGGLLDEHGGALPSAYVDALIRALDRDLERVLDDLGGGELPR
jgi:hypothetical protein